MKNRKYKVPVITPGDLPNDVISASI